MRLRSERGRSGAFDRLGLLSKEYARSYESHNQPNSAPWHGTTIVTVRKGGKVVIAGDGQVSMGQTVMKHNARKVRHLSKGGVIAGFAGATADAFTLLERLEAKLEQYPGQLMRASWSSPRTGAPTAICAAWRR